MAPQIIWRHVPEERLFWVCGGEVDALDSQVAAAAMEAGVQLALTMRPEAMESAGCLQVQIPFFSPEVLGAASLHGPVGLEVISTFCVELRKAIDQTAASAPAAVCVSCSTRPGANANSALLLGAFLVLERSMAAKDVTSLLYGPLARGGFMAEHRFPRPWTARPEWSRDSLAVSECLAGLETALSHGWLDYKTFDPAFRRTVSTAFDAVPVFSLTLLEQQGCDTADSPSLQEGAYAPDHRVKVNFWVMADPVTTVVNPKARDDSDISPQARSVLTTPSGNSPAKKVSAPEVRLVRCHSDCQDGTEVSELTPRAEWRQRGEVVLMQSQTSSFRLSTPKGGFPSKDHAQGDEHEQINRPEDLAHFASWLRNDLSCRALVRCNLAMERGLPFGSYTDFFDQRGVLQIDGPFQDGTAPPFEVVEKLVDQVSRVLLQMTKSRLSPQQGGHKSCSVVVHCKGGFGRSMSVLGAFAVAFMPEVSSSSFFGWARLVRPGCIQTAAQERFLRLLDEEATGCCCFGGSVARRKRLSVGENWLSGSKTSTSCKNEPRFLI